MRNILLTIKYDGTSYHGWQRQPGLATVQGTIEEALEQLVGQPFEIAGTGRTDAGVHALGQCATVQLPDGGIPTDRIPFALTNLLPEDIEILSAEEKPEGFHARFSAVAKTYRYEFLAAERHDLFARNYCWQIDEGPDTEAMKRAAAFFEGTHDFAAFQATGGEEKETTVRTIHRMEVLTGQRPEGLAISLEVTGDGFLYNMVRIIAGTLKEAAFGRIAPEDVPKIIEGKDRALAGPTAPARGLFLKKVYFSEDFLEERAARDAK